LRFHHLGIPTTEKRSDEIHLAHLQIYVSGYRKSPYGVEWSRYEDNAPYPTLVKTIARRLRGRRSGRGDPRQECPYRAEQSGPGVLVAFIGDNGPPIELLQIDRRIVDEGTEGRPPRQPRDT
jgi:hypothetical protein